MTKHVKYIEGQRINRFVLLENLKNRYWRIQCDCGNIVTVRRDHIQRRKSCGCIKADSQFKMVSTKQYITNVKLNHYKQSAKVRGLMWDLSFEEFYNLIIGDCHYCGDPPSQITKTVNHMLLTTGIDRIDSSIGYISGNVVSCCRFCNFAKSDSKLEDFLNWIDRLVIFKNKNNKNEHISN